MSGAHTPAPWERDRHGQLRGSNGEKVNVWDAGIGYASRSATTEANAKVCGAAAELLEALEEALHWFEGEHASDHPTTVKMQAAIAKARGEAQ